MARDITSPEETRISQSFKNYMPKAGGVVLMETDKNCPSYEVWRGHGLFFFFYCTVEQMVIRVQRKNKAGKEYEVWEGKEEVRFLDSGQRRPF